MVLLHFTMHL